MNDQFKQAFKDEAYERLAELESSLLELEETPDDAELVGRVFRSMHTIKGSGAMFGFDDIARFTHEVETVFDLVRNAKLAVTGDLVNLSLKARDRIKAMLDADGSDHDLAASEELVSAFRRLAEAGEAAPSPLSPYTTEAPVEGAELFENGVIIPAAHLLKKIGG